MRLQYETIGKPKLSNALLDLPKSAMKLFYFRLYAYSCNQDDIYRYQDVRTISVKSRCSEYPPSYHAAECPISQMASLIHQLVECLT